MATLIKERRIVADSWHLLERGSKGELPEVPARATSSSRSPFGWRAAKTSRLPGKLGVWIDANEGPEALAGDVQRFPLIAVNFPKFGDGRGYSIARLLRERYGYKGELRAIGDVLHDHLYFMEQCGFDAFALREDQTRTKRSPPHSALSATATRRPCCGPCRFFAAVWAQARHDRSTEAQGCRARARAGARCARARSFRPRLEPLREDMVITDAILRHKLEIEIFTLTRSGCTPITLNVIGAIRGAGR